MVRPTARRIQLLTYFLAVVLLLSPLRCQAQQETERETLTAFYVACNGEDWDEDDGWLDENVGLCQWKGVTCTGEALVGGIELRDNNVECEVPANLFYLPRLDELDLSGNHDITIDFASLDVNRTAPLSRLYFSDANVDSLEGLGALFADSLTVLGAAGNRINGEFPEEVLALTSLRLLDLSYNFLSGELPVEIVALSNLQKLYLSNNLFTGAIPSLPSQLSQLQIQHNEFSGSLPSALTSLPLHYITMNDNGDITGPLLDFASTAYLMYLDLSNNDLTGTIPEAFLASVNPDFSNLLAVDLSSNSLTGSIPESLQKFTAIRFFVMRNFITDIPSALCLQENWFFGDVGDFGCDAILCPPGTFGTFGRQISPDEVCKSCSNGAEFFGSTECVTMRGPSLDFGSQSATETGAPTSQPTKALTAVPTNSLQDGATWPPTVGEDKGSTSEQHHPEQMPTPTLAPSLTPDEGGTVDAEDYVDFSTEIVDGDNIGDGQIRKNISHVEHDDKNGMEVGNASVNDMERDVVRYRPELFFIPNTDNYNNGNSDPLSVVDTSPAEADGNRDTASLGQFVDSDESGVTSSRAFGVQLGSFLLFLVVNVM